MNKRCNHGQRARRSDGRCGLCHSANYDPLSYRVRMLPEQLERARRRVAHLEDEARRYGMTDLLEARP